MHGHGKRVLGLIEEIIMVTTCGRNMEFDCYAHMQ